MPEYINREALKDYVSSLSTHALVDWSPWGVMSAIDNIPAADVVEVVRCRDCEHYILGNVVIDGKRYMVCSYHITARYHREPDDYCSKGKRKDGGQVE